MKKEIVGCVVWLLCISVFAEKRISVDASDLTVEMIKENSHLKIRGILTSQIIEKFKRSGVEDYTSAPNFNVESVDLSEAVVQELLSIDSVFMNYLSLTSVRMPIEGAGWITSMDLAFLPLLWQRWI